MFFHSNLVLNSRREKFVECFKKVAFLEFSFSRGNSFSHSNNKVEVFFSFRKFWNIFTLQLVAELALDVDIEDEPVKFERQIKSKVQLKKQIETQREMNPHSSKKQNKLVESHEKCVYPNLEEEDKINIDIAISKACSKSSETGKNQRSMRKKCQSRLNHKPWRSFSFRGWWL